MLGDRPETSHTQQVQNRKKSSIHTSGPTPLPAVVLQQRMSPMSPPGLRPHHVALRRLRTVGSGACFVTRAPPKPVFSPAPPALGYFTAVVFIGGMRDHPSIHSTHIFELLLQTSVGQGDCRKHRRGPCPPETCLVQWIK